MPQNLSPRPVISICIAMTPQLSVNLAFPRISSLRSYARASGLPPRPLRNGSSYLRISCMIAKRRRSEHPLPRDNYSLTRISSPSKLQGRFLSLMESFPLLWFLPNWITSRTKMLYYLRNSTGGRKMNPPPFYLLLYLCF